MKGLLLKDLLLLSKQKIFFLLLSVVAIIQTVSSPDSNFAIIYLVICVGIFSASTITYDEFDNGYSFLFTLPFSRKMYVIEKYVLSLLSCIVPWFIATLLVGLGQRILLPSANLAELILNTVSSPFVLLFMLSFSLPLQLRFGAEKGRIALFIMYGAFAAVFALFFGLIKSPDADLIRLFNRLDNSGSMLTILLAVFVLIIFAVSGCISIRIMEKKQF